MTAQPHLLKESFARLEPVADRLAALFYGRLFVANPQLRDLFPVMMDAQRSRLLRALVRVVQGLDSPLLLEQYLRQLGHDHRKFGVRPEHYEAVGRALIGALRECSRDAWTAEVEQAWTSAYRIVADRMLAGAEAGAGAPAWWDAQVVGHERLGNELALLAVRPDQPYPYLPGQYLSLQTPRRARLWRTYSIANPPRPDGLLTFHVRAVPGGWVSNALVAHTRPGDVLQLGPPLGSMRVDPNSIRDLLFIAGGTGLAPIEAMVTDLVRWNQHRRAHLFVGARRTEELYHLSDLCRLAGQHPWLTVVAAASHDPAYIGRRGMISDVVASYGNWTDHDAFVSGPPAMVRATVGRLLSQRVPTHQVRFDPLGE